MPLSCLPLACALALAAACSGSVNGEYMPGPNGFDAAWEQVRNAPDADTQRQKIVESLRRNEAAGAPALQISVWNPATGAKAAIDDALWANPDSYEVRLRFGEREYRFVPKSRASLEPLLRE